MKTYITYGFILEDPSKIVTNLDEVINKPKKALWGSPIDAEFGWRDWCEGEDWWPGGEPDYFDKSFKWTLKEGSKILTINKVEDLDDIYRAGLMRPNKYGFIALDFYRILDVGYSAVELTDGHIGHMFVNRLEDSFNSWDCESIVVLDPDAIILLDNSNTKKEVA